MSDIDSRGFANDEAKLHAEGGGRTSRKLLIIGSVAAVMAAVAITLGIEQTQRQRVRFGEGADVRPGVPSGAEVADLMAHGIPTPVPTPRLIVPYTPQQRQQQVQAAQPHESDYQRWVKETILKGLSAPQMVGAFHDGHTLELARKDAAAPAASSPAASDDPTTARYHGPAPADTIMAGSIIPATLITGVNSDDPGVVTASVSQPVYDTRTGHDLLIPQLSRIIGTVAQHNGDPFDTRVRIDWTRLIFPDTSWVDLPRMPADDAQGFAGVTGDVNRHIASGIGFAAVMSLISIAPTMAQVATMPGGGGYPGIGSYYGNQYGLIEQQAGATASGNMGQVAANQIERRLNRPATITLQPGFQFNVMVTQDIVLTARKEQQQWGSTSNAKYSAAPNNW